MARKRRRRDFYKEYRSDDPCDGMDVNTVSGNRFISRRNTSFTVFDRDDVAIELGAGNDRMFKRLSIMAKVRYVNRKASNLNGYKERIKGRE